MYPQLKLKLADARVDWDRAANKIVLSGSVGVDKQSVQFSYFLATCAVSGESTSDSLTSTRAWIAWAPLRPMLLDILENPDGQPLPGNLRDHSVLFTPTSKFFIYNKLVLTDDVFLFVWLNKQWF
jgi:hypothetical protein